jgi:heme oxygenase (biliverdin-IX-beta and delta-forming)
MILAKLKESTREQHVDLEQTIDIMGQMNSIKNYKSLLIKFYRFYAAIESELGKLDWKLVSYDFEERRKIPKIEKDLAVLGILEEARNASVYNGLPNLDSIKSAFGSLYVVEGASLGGQIINRHLKQKLDLSPENGGAFFSGYGEKTGEMWKEFCTFITEFSESNNADETIINTAKRTFESFKNCYLESITIANKSY